MRLSNPGKEFQFCRDTRSLSNLVVEVETRLEEDTYVARLDGSSSINIGTANELVGPRLHTGRPLSTEILDGCLLASSERSSRNCVGNQEQVCC